MPHPGYVNDGPGGGGAALPTPVSVESAVLAPVMAGDGSGLPHDMWRGLDVQKFEALVAGLALPPRSPALGDLWRRLLTVDTGDDVDPRFEASRMEALYRSGLVEDMGRLLSRHGGEVREPIMAMLGARAEIGLGREDAGCRLASGIAGKASSLPQMLVGEAILIVGYCAAVGGNAKAAGLAADLARNEGRTENAVGLAALDAIAYGTKPSIPGGQPVSLIEYRLAQKAGLKGVADDLKRASPALLAVLASDPALAPGVRVAAAEAAARVQAVDAATFAAAYRDAAASPAAAAREDPGLMRAQVYAGAEAERTPLQKVRLVRGYLDSARRAGFYLTALRAMAPVIDTLRPVTEIGWFAETAIEISLAAGQSGRAREWVRIGREHDPRQAGSLDHWLGLIDLAEADSGARRGDNLQSVEAMALSGRFAPDLLHRLATVLDALDTHVPIPLWEAASRTPQPTSGHLPDTGVLSDLQLAAKSGESGRTVLLAMRALGPEGPEGAHMIALGDAIRALKRAGLEADARKIAVEALLRGWPRAASG